jgi:energy-converting hydrogenase Eha subunit A
MLTGGLTLAGLSIVSPLGFGVGALRWQPIFFGPILIVLGSLAAVSGAVIANNSPLLRPDVAGQFSFAGSARFPSTCIRAGIGALAIGLAIDLALFFVWVTQQTSPARALSLAGLAQALIITGTSLAGFGVVQRVMEARQRYQREAVIDVAAFEPRAAGAKHP